MLADHKTYQKNHCGELQKVGLSFDTFTWDSQLHVDYRINEEDGWVDIDEFETWTSGYTLASISFGAALDNQADVDFRIRTENWGSLIGYLDIDNVQVTAVPEPTSALLLGLGVWLIAARRRRG